MNFPRKRYFYAFKKGRDLDAFPIRENVPFDTQQYKNILTSPISQDIFQ